MHSNVETLGVWMFTHFGLFFIKLDMQFSFCVKTFGQEMGSDEVQVFLFYLGFLSQTFMIHRTAGERGGYSIHSSVSLPPASQALRH